MRIQAVQVSRMVGGKAFTYEAVPRQDLSGVVSGYDMIPVEGGSSFFLQTSGGGEPSVYLLDQKLSEYMTQNPQLFVTSNWLSFLDAVVAYVRVGDLGIHVQDNSDGELYANSDPDETDYRPGSPRTHAPAGVGTPDGEDTHKSKGNPGLGMTVLKEDMMSRGKDDSTGWTASMQPSSEPYGGTWDGLGSTAPEGDNPAYGKAYATVHRVASATRPSWTVAEDGLFDRFVGTVVPTLAGYKASGMSRDNADFSIRQINAGLFSKAEWMPALLNRFLDKVYGTEKRATCESRTMAASIAKYAADLRAAGVSKDEAESKMYVEFSSWVDNSPSTSLYVRACMDRNYGVRLDNMSKEDMVKTVSGLSARNAAGTYYVNLLLAQNPALPVDYVEFRTWCAVQQLPADTFHIVESAALELNLISLPEGLTILAEDKEVYVSQDKSKVSVQPKNPDASQSPEKIVDPAGTELKKVVIP